MRLGLSLRSAGLIVPIVLVVFASSACVRSPEAKSAAAMEVGKKLLEQKDAARAILQFRNATQATPTNPEAQYQLALAYLAAGDLPSGVASLRRALELNPQHAGARFLLADLMAQTNDPEVLKDAEKRLQGLLQDSPQNADALHALALTELKLGEPDDAVQNLERAVASAPKELIFQVTLAQAKLTQKDSKAAEAILKKASDDFPTSPDSAVILGRFYSSHNRAAEAEQQFRRALARDPNHGAALLNLATLQLQMGRRADAEKLTKQLSGRPEAMFKPVYANFLFQQGRREEAVLEFERLAKQDPDDRMARTRLVAAYQAVGRLPDAQKLLSDALKKNQKDLDALLQRGELFLRDHKYAEAEADFNNVLRLKPDAPEVHYALGRLYQAGGSPQRQRQELAEALRLNPRLVRIRIELAESMIAANASQAALDLLAAAPEDQKDLSAVVEQRNWAYLKGNRYAEARKGVDQGLRDARTPELLLQDSVLKISAKNYIEARRSLYELLAKSPENLRALRVLVGSYAAQNEMKAAVAEVQAYAAQHPKSGGVQYFWGNLLLETGDRTQAKQVLAAAKALDPGNTQADLSLARIDLLQANWKDARSQLTTILSSGSENPLARQWLGMLEVSSGNQTAAINHFRKVIETQPNNAVALNNLAYLLAENGNQTEEPLKYAEKAVGLDPGNPEFEDTLGWVLYRRAVYDLAVRHLESAVSTRSTALRNYHLAMAYSKVGKEERGRTALTAALSMDPSLPEAKVAQQMFPARNGPGTGR